MWLVCRGAWGLFLFWFVPGPALSGPGAKPGLASWSCPCGGGGGFSVWIVGRACGVVRRLFLTESLILAQDERWRRA